MSEAADRQVGFSVAGLLLVGSCLPILGAVLLAPLLPLIQQAFADTPGVEVLTAITLTAPGLAIALVSPFAGLLADRLGRKRLLVAALPFYALFGTAPLYLQSLPLIAGSRFLLGGAEAIIMTICTTLLGDYHHGRTRERMMALQTVCVSASSVVFVVAGGLLGVQGWRTPFWLYTVGLLLAPLAAALLWEPLNRAQAKRSARPIPWGRVGPLCALTVVMAVALYIVPAQVAFLLRGIGVADTAVAGLVNGAGQFAVLAGATSFTTLRRRLSFPVIGAIGFGIAGAGLVGLSQAHALAPIVAAAMINNLGIGMLVPGLLAWVTGLLDLEQRGRGTGAFTASLFFGQFLSPLIVIGISAPLGGLSAAVGAIGAAVLLAVPAVLLAGRGAPPRL